MSKILSILLLYCGLSASSFSQEIENTQEGEELATIQLPFAVEMGKPITFNMKYTESMEGASFVVLEEVLITPLRVEGDSVIYKAVSKGASVESMEGLPSGMDELMQELIKQSSGLSYEYSADNTGYPVALVESKDVKAFMKKMVKSMKRWFKKFAKSEKMNKRKKAQLNTVLDQSVAPFLTKDNEKLSRLVLETGELAFAGTGRKLYVDYQTVFDNTRYFEDGEIYMHIQDHWQVDEQSDEAGTISISMTSMLHPEEFPKFIEELKASLKGEYTDEQIVYIVDVWSKMKLNRSASYIFDAKTGLPLSGTITSEVFFEGKPESQEIKFTSTY